MKNFNRNLKGISPIFATLILIAIAVIAGVVVYTFTSGTLATMTGGGTAGTEKVQIQGVQSGAYSLSGKTSTLTIYAQSSTGNVPIPNLLIKDGAGTIVGTGAVIATTNPTPSTNQIGTSLTTATSLITWTIVPTVGASYTATLVSTAGGNFVSPSFAIPSTTT
jgi:flagellin-like protein